MKHMASNFAKLDKFNGVDFRRWKKKMHFLLSSMSVVYVLTTPIPEDGGDNPTVEQVRQRAKWDNDDYVCRGLILKEDVSSKKFLVSNFTNYKMTDLRPVMEQYIELLGILGRFTQHKMNMDEAIQCMRTRNSNFPNNSTVTIPRRRNKRRAPNVVEPELRTIVEVAPMAERTMEELLQAPTEGYGEAIVIPEINADHFEIKTNLLQLVQASPFHGYERENPHAHINTFKRITSTLRFRDVPNDVIKLMMFPYSLEGAAKVWYEKEPPNSILTWEDLVTKFVNQFFPPSKTTHLKNEISRFTQKFEETFSEAWERFKEMLRACPHHGFSELTQVDTFYNGLNDNDQDSLNAAAGGNLLSKTTREALNIIENKSKVRYSRNKSNVSRMNTTSRESVSKTDERIDKLADQISTLVEIVSKKVVTPAPVKAVEEICVTCSGPHAWYNCPNTDNNQSSVCAATGSYNQVSLHRVLCNYMAPPDFARVFNASNNHAPNLQTQGTECFDLGGDNDEINAFLAIKISTYIEEGYYDSDGDVFYLERLLIDDW
ncbi:reverse transcriptase domain-containing protein [Tanacetum coccineum]